MKKEEEEDRHSCLSLVLKLIMKKGEDRHSCLSLLF
jgi:hypothetical protein